MKMQRFPTFFSLCLIAIMVLSSCDLSPTPTPTPTVSPTLVPPTSTSQPTRPPTQTPTPTLTPTQTPQPTIISIPSPQATVAITGSINFTRQQYNEALKKWRDAAVREYELVVRFEAFSPFAGTWNLHVLEDVPEIISFRRLMDTPTTPTVGGDALKFLAVDDRFALIEDRLTRVETNSLSSIDRQSDFLVTFDATYGYPASVEVKAKPNASVSDIDSSVRVESLKIIRRGTPVVP
ncbi:MAG: DUF6174 domain-containing protein [Chloroflexia bacterium]